MWYGFEILEVQVSAFLQPSRNCVQRQSNFYKWFKMHEQFALHCSVATVMKKREKMLDGRGAQFSFLERAYIQDKQRRQEV